MTKFAGLCSLYEQLLLNWTEKKKEFITFYFYNQFTVYLLNFHFIRRDFVVA